MSIERLDDPLELFRLWYNEALACGAMDEPTAMSLATADATGAPSARIVLLKGYDARGFSFYTNTLSEKGRELAANPHAALCFHWMPMGRQVRVRGEVESVSPEEADTYFASRPRESQIGAWASEQSEVLESRSLLERRFAEFTEKFEGNDIPRPPHWSGYRVVPSVIEFWQKMPHRLHARLEYLPGESGWASRWLNP